MVKNPMNRAIFAVITRYLTYNVHTVLYIHTIKSVTNMITLYCLLFTKMLLQHIPYTIVWKILSVKRFRMAHLLRNLNTNIINSFHTKFI